MIDITIVHNDPNIIDKFKQDYNGEAFMHFLDRGSKIERSKAYKLQQAWGSKLTPFAIVEKDAKVIKAFYKESSDNVINDLINYLNENNY